MVLRCKFPRALLALDDVLKVELFRGGEGLEQFDGQLRQLAGLITLEVINGFDVRVGFALVLLVSAFFVLMILMIMSAFLFVIAILRMLARTLFAHQSRGDIRFFHAAARFVVEPEQPITIFQCVDCLVQRGMVCL